MIHRNTYLRVHLQVTIISYCCVVFGPRSQCQEKLTIHLKCVNGIFVNGEVLDTFVLLFVEKILMIY